MHNWSSQKTNAQSGKWLAHWQFLCQTGCTTNYVKQVAIGAIWGYIDSGKTQVQDCRNNQTCLIFLAGWFSVGASPLQYIAFKSLVIRVNRSVTSQERLTITLVASLSSHWQGQVSLNFLQKHRCKNIVTYGSVPFLRYIVNPIAILRTVYDMFKLFEIIPNLSRSLSDS